MFQSQAIRPSRCFVAIVLCLVGGAFAQTTQPATGPATRPSPEVLEAFQPREIKSGDRLLFRYRIMSPAPVEPDVKYPLVVFLHGSGERGDDNVSQLIHAAEEFLATREKHPAYVLFPQCPKGLWWDGPNPRRAEAAPEDAVVPMPYVFRAIDMIAMNNPVDRSRIYITGLSMGGFGTFRMVQINPDLFAAAVPVCGGGDPAWADRIARTPFWIFHGSDDPIVPPEESRRMFEALRPLNADTRYTEYPGVGHDAWTPTYSNPEVFDWMFSQRRD